MDLDQLESIFDEMEEYQIPKEQEELWQQLVKAVQEGRIDVAAIATEMAMSMTPFRRRFTALLGDRPQAYIGRLRMERARRLIDEHPELNISEVALKCGFDDKSNFTRAFKHVHGITPSEYLHQQQ